MVNHHEPHHFGGACFFLHFPTTLSKSKFVVFREVFWILRGKDESYKWELWLCHLKSFQKVGANGRTSSNHGSWKLRMVQGGSLPAISGVMGPL